jgi:hypothetical protein
MIEKVSNSFYLELRRHISKHISSLRGEERRGVADDHFSICFLNNFWLKPLDDEIESSEMK